MRENIYLNFMQSHVLFILSLVLLWFNTTAAISLGHQLVAEAGPGDAKTCIDKERQALLDFKTRIVQDPDDMFSKWVPEDDCCQWDGVECDSVMGHVTELDFNSFGFVGKISHSLLNLTYLNYLDLSKNSFHGNFPEFISAMAHLTHLILDDCQFTGTIPESIGNMTELTQLNLAGNNFSGDIPKSICSLTKLKTLALSDNSLSGTIPIELGNLTNLENLFLDSLGSCRVENFAWLSSLISLEELHMDGISLDKADKWVNVIIGLRNLTDLSLVGCDLSKVMHPYSSSVKSSLSIRTLFLYNNNLNSSMYRWLCPLTGQRLRLLSLSGNKLDGKLSDFLNILSGCTSATLENLDASSNQFAGSLSDEIQHFSSLHFLNLSSNQLDGTISDKLREIPSLRTLDLSSNALRDVVPEISRKSNIFHMDLSRNLLEGFPVNADMSNLSESIEYIDFRSNKLGPRFPKWIQKLKNLLYLDLSSNNISDAFPTYEWKQWRLQLGYLNLSFNNISGKLPDFLSDSDRNILDFSSNNFDGPIPDFPVGVSFLDLSKNRLHGGISFLCKMYEHLKYLDLSRNSLTGQLSDCFGKVTNLTVLNLGHNFFLGRLPPSLGYLSELVTLSLYNNSFTGELPLSLQNCANLSFLDLGANKFSGNVPVWIGDNLSRLYVLSLRSNDFFGTIPLQICHLVSLQILDLSINNLHGTIPSCVNNLTTMVQKGFAEKQNIHHYEWSVEPTNEYRYEAFVANSYMDRLMIGWQGKVNEFSSTLGFVKTIDLSSNNITGEIPSEITNLHELLVLDLSNNSLVGEIPRDIGQMKELLTLNLSRNFFSGEMPSTMSQMDRLNDLDVSYNNLQGRVPSSTQLQSFPSERFTGNVGLCGLPTMKKCPGDEDQGVPPVSDSEGDAESTDELQRWFYIGGATGFATAFWIACSALLFHRRLRHAFFHCNNCLKDWVYVKRLPIVADDGEITRIRETPCSVDAILEFLKGIKGCDAMISDDAGRFVCNYVYYQSLRFAEEKGHKSLFVHVPPFTRINEEAQMQFMVSLLEAIAATC